MGEEGGGVSSSRRGGLVVGASLEKSPRSNLDPGIIQVVCAGCCDWHLLRAEVRGVLLLASTERL